MLVENQLVEVKWCNPVKKWYEERGYQFTKNRDSFVVRAEDLPITSQHKVDVKCDRCGIIKHLMYYDYQKSLKKYGKYYCRNCANKITQQILIKDKKSKYIRIFEDWCNENNYKPISTIDDYKNAKSKLYFECPIHGIGTVSYNNILQGQKSGGCCKGEKLKKVCTTPSDIVKQEIENKNNNILLNPEDYVNAHTSNLRIICGSCGKEFITSRSSISNSDGRCFSCGRNVHNWKSFDRILQHRYDKYLSRCLELNYTPTMTLGDFGLWDNKRFIKFICPEHGEVEQQYDNFVSNNGICKYCADEIRGNKLKYNIEELLEIISSKNNNILLNPEEYIGSNERNLKIKCGSCGKVFIQSLNNYKRANLTGKCPDCNEISYGEYLIVSYLDKHGVNYNRWHSFPDCRDKQPLPFDFYLEEYNLCIEYDGEQHFYPKFGIDNFVMTKLHDAMKNQYCKWNNIDLLRIPYWDRDNIEQILIDYLHLTPLSNSKPTKIKYISNRKLA